MRGLVRAHVLDDEAPQRIAGDVEGKDAAVPKFPLLLRPDEEETHGDIPQRLVEESGMDAGDDLARGTTRHRGVLAGFVDAVVDVERPRHGGLAAVEFLVKPVAEAANGLSEDESGGHGVGEGREGHLLHLEHGPERDRAQGYRAPNAQATVGHLEHVHGVAALAKVLIVVRDDVVQAPANDAGGDDDDGRVPHGVRVAAARGVATQRKPQRDEDAEDNA